MRSRRVLVCALGAATAAAPSTPTAPSATINPALHQQHRPRLGPSRHTFAPQKRGSFAPNHSAGESRSDASGPHPMVVENSDTAPDPQNDPEPQQLASDAAEQENLGDTPTLDMTEDAAATASTTGGSDGSGPSSAQPVPGTRRDFEWKQERVRLAKLRRRLLIGAHSALQSLAGEDRRAHTPRLAVEKATIIPNSAAPVTDSRDAESSLPEAPARLCVKEPQPLLTPDGGGVSTQSATARLSITEALRVFANTFALTLHSTSQQWRTRFSAATSPVLPVFSSPSSVSITGTPLSLSFLRAPLGIVAAPCALGSVTQRTMVIEETAPLRWLETSFVDLCDRLLREIYDHYGSATGPHGLLSQVQDQAAVLLRAVDQETRAVNSYALHVMRRQCRKDAIAAAGRGRATGRRKSSTRAPKDTNVEDTLQNTLERLGQQLHLVHAWIIHLCTDGDEGDAVATTAEAAACVAQRALRWGTLRTAVVTSAVTLNDVRWMFAVALLECLHTQTYRFHHAKAAAADRDKTRGPAVVVEAHHLRGLAALTDFAMEQRLEVPPLLAAQPNNRGAETLPPAVLSQEEPLLEVIMLYHALLPTYALLLPLYHRVVVLATTPTATPSKERYTLLKPGSSVPLAFSLSDTDSHAEANQWQEQDALTASRGEDSNGRLSDEARKLADVRTAEASPLRVWDALVQHWEREQQQIRSEGVAAVVWWLRILPSWISTATDALQLRFILVGSGHADALRTADPLQVLGNRAAAVLRDALNFDRNEYERSRGAQRLLATRSTFTRSGVSCFDDAGISNGGKADSVSESGTTSAPAAGVTGEGGACGGSGGAGGRTGDAPPPLRRQRGKRSLFYKSPSEANGGVLVREGQDASARRSGNGLCGSTRSRFESRSRAGAGFAAMFSSPTLDAFGGIRRCADDDAPGAGQLRHGRAASASAAKKRSTSSIIQALVLSSESPIILSTLFRLDAQRRQSCFEEAWAATVHAQSELWRLLYALPPAAGAANEAASHKKVNSATLLRNALPGAVMSLVGATTVKESSGVANGPDQRGAAATASPPTSSVQIQMREETLRRVLCVLQSAQQQFGLSLFESLHHLMVSIAEVLLRIEHMNDSAPSSLRTLQESNVGKRTLLDRVRQRQAFVNVLNIGAALLLAGNPLPWESAQAAWQLQQQLRYPRVALHADSTVPRARFVPVADDEFAVQWMKAVVKDMSLLHVSCRQHADVVLTNALEMLRVLQTPSTCASLPFIAKQVTLVALLRSLSVLAGQWRQRRDATQKGFRVRQVAGLAEVKYDEVMRLYHALLDLLRDDGALRLLCCNATFVGELFEIHVRLKADLTSLIEWADTHLLPSVLTVVVAALHRSQSTDNASAHADVCEATLVLLSQLSRYAANPQMSVVDVVRTQWNQVLLQVSLYCIRTAGRGGRKRAPDYGLPPPVLPNMDDIAAPHQQLHGADAAAVAAAASRQWVEAFTGGRTPLFLALLHRSEALLGNASGLQSRSAEVAETTTSALAAYIAAWGERVRFGGRDWDTDHSVIHEDIADDPTVATCELLALLQVSYEAVQAFCEITSPALQACAAVAPFMAANPNSTRQLGFLVRFMEQHLRVQERLSRLADDEVDAFILPSRTRERAVSPVAGAGAKQSASSPSSSLAVSAATVSETAPLVLLDFVGYLSSRSVWAMVTWACNIAETVVKIELKHHRHIPEAVKAVATTAILSQIRAVPPPLRGAGKPPVNILRALLGLSDVVAGTTESLLGYHRRSVIRGLLSSPTRDQYRVVTFGLKQATAYVQEEARQYHGQRGDESDTHDASASAMVDGDPAAVLQRAAHTEEAGEAYSTDETLHFRMNADGTIDRTWLATGAPGLPAPPRQQEVGIYYVKVWAAYAAQERLRATAGSVAGAPEILTPYLRTDLNREYRFFLSCLVCLVDACMESVLLYLQRLQGDGEEDIRLLVEAAVLELCRTVSATIHALLSLTPEVRRACCQREASELLWSSLCIISTISAVVPRDPQERFFTPRCTEAIGRVFSLTRRLVDDVIETMATTVTPIGGAADSTTVRGEAATTVAATREADVSLAHRPLCTALVRGAQLLMRDPHSSQRMSIRLAMRQRERDDLSAVLVALQVLIKSTAAYEPGRRLLHHVWTRLAAELSQPLLDSAVATAAQPHLPASKSKKAKKPAASTLRDASQAQLNVAATVISRSEYGAVLRGLAAVCAAPSHSLGTDGKLEVDENADDAANSAGPGLVVVCDVAAAVQHVVEDAAGIEEERRRCLNQSASQEEWHYAGVANSDGLASPTAVGGLTSPLLLHLAQDVSSGLPSFSVAEAMESGAMPATAIVDAVITHAAATVRAAGGRSSLDTASVPGVIRGGSVADGVVADVEDDPATAVGFLRLAREFQRHVTELLSLVSLRDITARPQAEVLFACIGLLHGTVSTAAEDRVWELMATKWSAELLAPGEQTFLRLQELELAKVRELRAMTLRDARSASGAPSRGGAPGVSHSNGSSPHSSLPWGAAVLDMFSAAGRTPTARSAQVSDELSVLAAAECSMRHHWCADGSDLPRHDDVSRMWPGDGSLRKSPRGEGMHHPTQEQRGNDPVSSLRLDPQATGMAALAAMPAPIPIPVVLTIFKVLGRRPVEHPVPGAQAGSTQAFDMRKGGMTANQAAVTASWLAKGGNDGSDMNDTSGRDTGAEWDSFRAFAEVFLTYTARAYWLLRPRLDDNAWAVWAIMEKSMAVYPTDNGVRQREWDRVCRQWRLPVSLDRAHAAAGQLFTGGQRHHIKAWTTALCPAACGEGTSTSVSPKAAEEAEEVVVLRYLQAASLYLHLLAMTMLLLSRLGMFGDLPKASIDVVRRRVQAQVLQHRSPGDRSATAAASSASAVSREALTRELAAMAQERQTQPSFVNRNLFEGATLQLLNVLWCVVRHADSLTHTATDTVVARFQAADATALRASAAPPHPRATQLRASSESAIVSYADHVRIMVAGVVQDTLDMVTSLGSRVPVTLPHLAVKALLTSGFSCEPLTLRLPAHDAPNAATTSSSSAHNDRSATHTDGTNNCSSALAVNVIAKYLSTTASGPSPMALDATLFVAPAGAAAPLSSTPDVAVTRSFNLVARPELFVGSPTMLAILSPQFVRSTICRSLEASATSSTLLPVALALEFYLSRHGVPLAPLLEATTELLTACTLRNNAVHMYCERLASELTSRKEFRQALAPPTIASAEQGAAGSISNEIVISFLAAIARRDVLVTKKTLAHLLHSVMRMRPDVFGQPPTENRQGKLTLVQVGTTVDSAIDTSNPLYTPAQPAAKQGNSDVDGPRDSVAVMNAFSLEKWSDATAMTHRKALAALTISLPTVVEVAMHMDSMRSLDPSEWRRAIQMLKTADEARRERVAVHRSHAQAAIQQGHVGSERGGEESDAQRPPRVDSTAAAAGKLDASLHLEDPFDFGVGMLHLRYALRKIVHASLRRLLHQQGPRMLADVASILQMVDPALQQTRTLTQASSSVADPRDVGARGRHPSPSSGVRGVSVHGVGPSADHPRPFDGVLAGTTRVLLSRAVLCAQAIGYDSTGAALEMSPRNDSSHPQGAQPVLKLPVPALQPSAVEAAISATASASAHHLGKGRQVRVGHSTGKIGQLSKEEKATVHQRVELERDAATTVGLTTVQLPPQGVRRILRALRFTRRHVAMKQRQQEYRKRRERRHEKPRGSGSLPHHAESSGGRTLVGGL